MTEETPEPGPEALLETLIHGIHSKCAGLKGAATLLKQAKPQEARELLTLMLEQAEALTREIGEFRRGGGIHDQ